MKLFLIKKFDVDGLAVYFLITVYFLIRKYTAHSVEPGALRQSGVVTYHEYAYTL